MLSSMEAGDKLPQRSSSHSPVQLSSQVGDDSDLTSAHLKAAKPPLPWFTESYFSKDPATIAARKVYILILASRGVLIILLVLSVLSIYWGALWQTPRHVHNLHGWVVVSLVFRHPPDSCAMLMSVRFWFHCCGRTLMAVRWVSSSRARWSQVMDDQLRCRGTLSPRISFQTGHMTLRMPSYKRKPGLS
jgi:hypothetical protein